MENEINELQNQEIEETNENEQTKIDGNFELEEIVLGGEPQEDVLFQEDDCMLVEDDVLSEIENLEKTQIKEDFIENQAETLNSINENHENVRKTGVYIKVNDEGFITDVDSDLFIDNLDGWIKIDEGVGDKFDHAQSLYFESPIVDEFGNYQLKQ